MNARLTLEPKCCLCHIYTCALLLLHADCALIVCILQKLCLIFVLHADCACIVHILQQAVPCLLFCVQIAHALSVSYNKLGGLECAFDHMQAAVDLYQKGLTIREPALQDSAQAAPGEQLDVSAADAHHQGCRCLPGNACAVLSNLVHKLSIMKGLQMLVGVM